MRRSRAAPQSDRVSHNLPVLADGARPASGDSAQPAEQHVSRLCDFSRRHAWATAHNKTKAGKTLENACLQRDNDISKFS